ncbi:MAG: GNAT family N-acetyltransferase [Candidatus Gastranaerophilales bacterium]|nr:GNAT family N-acetyltransferase [Candidatus Gastranaerophilales bacterium]
MNICIEKANPTDLNMILPYLQEFKLDMEELNYNDFLVAKIKNKIIGFGRIKKYEMLTELASIGVLKEYRLKGFGTKIVQQLIGILDKKEIWLSTRCPEFFEKLGFEIDKNPPIEVKAKNKRICKNASTNSDSIAFMKLDTKKESG